MGYTAIQLVRQVTAELGLSQPTTAVGSTNIQTVQILALLQKLGKDLVREYEWKRLVKQYAFATTAAVTATGDTTEGSTSVSNLSINTSTLVDNMIVTGSGIPSFTESVIASSSSVTLSQPAQETATGVDLTFAYQDYDLPADFDRMISETFWDRTDAWRNSGAKSPQEWQTLQGAPIAGGMPVRFRIYATNKVRISPALTTAALMAYEYASNYWVLATGASTAVGTKASVTADDDTFIFHDDLMQAGLKYYFLKAKKLNYAEEKVEYFDILQTRQAQDQPSATRSLAGCTVYPEGPTIAQGSWDLD